MRNILLVAVLAGSASLASAQTTQVWRFEDVGSGNIIPGCVRGMTVAGFEYDVHGRPVIAWREENGCGGPPRVFWSRQEPGGPWVPTEFFSERRYQGGAPADYAHRLILRPSDGNPFLVYGDVGAFNEINTYRADIGANPSGGVSTYLENLVGPQNCAYVSYALGFSPLGSLPDWSTGLALCNGQGPIRLDGNDLFPSTVYNARPAMAVTADGTRHVLWNTGTHLFYSRWPVGDPAPTTNPTPLFTNINRFGGEVRLLADGSVLHALVRGYEGQDADWDTGAVVYFNSTDGGQTWSSPEYVDPDNEAAPGTIGVTSNVSLALDAAGVPAVTYWRWNQELYYAKRDGAGGTWKRSLVTLEPGWDAPRENQLRFEPDGGPVIAFYDIAANMLRLARPFPVGAEPAVDLVLTGSVDTPVTSPGAPVTYTLTIRNAGDVNVRNLVLSNVLPAGVTFGDASPSPGADGTWHFDWLTSHASITVTLHATAPLPSGDFIDRATVSSDGIEATPGNNSAVVGLTIRPAGCLNPPLPPECGPPVEGANAAVSIVATPSPSMTGDLVTYTIKVTNHGTADLADIVLDATLPPGSTVFDAIPAASSSAGGALTLAIPALPAGGSTFFVVRAHAPQATGPVVATAHVTAPGDVDPSDDTATANLEIQSDACFVPRDGLVAKYRGEGDARDSVSGRDGRVAGVVPSLPGHQGQAFYFTGGLDYITVPDSPAFRPARFTLSAWVNPYILASGYWNSVVAKGASGADPGIPGYGNSFWLGFYDGFPTLYTHHEGNDGRSVQAAARASDHVWHHLAATYDGTTARLYVDGTLAGQTPVGTPLYYDAHAVPLTIGTDWTDGHADVTVGLTASVDEVMLYDRALGAAEIQALAAGSPADCVSAGPPTVVVPADITVVTNDPAGQPVTFTATAADADGTPLVPVCAPASGSVFTVGATTVTCTATDTHGATASGTFTVTVVLNGPPTVVVPADITVPATGPAGAAVSFVASADDDEDGALAVSCAPASGTTFAIGVTSVACSAVDSRGLPASATFNVTVLNNPPAIQVPADITVEGNTLGGAVVAFTSSGQDVEDGTLVPDCQSASGSTFPIGATLLVCTVTDSRGATASGAFTIRVVDTTPPVFSVSDLSRTAPTSGGVAVTYSFTATDVVDGTDPVSCVPASGAVFALGATTVACSATDNAGNTTAHSFVVTVTVAPPAPCDGPNARNDAYATAKGVRLDVRAPGVLANDTDPQGHRLAATLISGPAHGRLTLRADGSFTYTPTSGFSGVDQFVYSAKDSGGRSDRATVTIKVGHFDHDGCGHDQHHYGHHDRDGCAHDREDHDRDRHSDGDRCDHEQRRRGHYDGDGCDHDRRWRR